MSINYNRQLADCYLLAFNRHDMVVKSNIFLSDRPEMDYYEVMCSERKGIGGRRYMRAHTSHADSRPRPLASGEIVSDDDAHQNLYETHDEVNETDYNQQVHSVRARMHAHSGMFAVNLQRFVRTSTTASFDKSTESTKKFENLSTKHRNAQRPSRATGSCGFELRGRSRNLLPRYRNERRKIRCATHDKDPGV